MLLVLQKHLYTESIVYLSKLINRMDLNSHTEQVNNPLIKLKNLKLISLSLSLILFKTFLLCLTITKSLWSLMFNFVYEREKKNNKNTLVFQPLVQTEL
jgi:hypothetical protein